MLRLLVASAIFTLLAPEVYAASKSKRKSVAAPAPAAAPAPLPPPPPVAAPAPSPEPAVVAAAPAAPAAPAEDPKILEEAKRHFVQGVALFNDGNFSAALAEFESAYKVRSSPGVLYNIGLTQKSLFRYTDAIDTLTKYLGADAKLSPERKAEVTQLITEMKALLADVTLDVTPKGAAILIGGRTIATAPLTKPLGIAAGNHVIEVTAEGYKPARKEIIVTAGVAMKIKIDLVVVPKSAKVSFTGNPQGISLMVDGKTVGAPPVALQLGMGGHQVEAWATGYAKYRNEIIIAGGEDRLVHINLDKRFYKKAAFWVPISILLAGGIAAAVVVPIVLVPDTLIGTLDPGAAGVTP